MWYSGYMYQSPFFFVCLQAKIVNVLLNKYNVSPEDLAVLTPYTAQKKLIQREFSDGIKVKVRTITESQGVFASVCTYT